jgi:hypothetical protein
MTKFMKVSGYVILIILFLFEIAQVVILYKNIYTEDVWEQ